MPAFLSPDWFDQALDRPAPPDERTLVIQQIVVGSPYGDVAYLVVVGAGGAWIERPGPGVTPDLTLTVDYQTAAAIAQGDLSTQRALMQGRLRVKGSTKALSGRLAELAGLDPMPPELRKNTTY